MKTFQLIAILVIAFAAAACSKSAPQSAPSSSADARSATSSDSPGVSTLGKSSFSAVVDGTRVSGGAIDTLQQGNAAYVIPGPKGDQLLFLLYDNSDADTTKFTHCLRFNLTKQTGSAANAHLSVTIQGDKLANYYTSEPDIVITSMTGNRLVGTFSASRMKRSPDTPNAPKAEISITDGKFDIPFATSKLIPM